MFLHDLVYTNESVIISSRLDLCDIIEKLLGMTEFTS